MLLNCVKELCVDAQRIGVLCFLPLLFLSVGDSHARLPTPPQAQRDLLVLTVPAPQGSRVACWVPHFSKILGATAAGLPQECFLTTASVTGTNRKRREGGGRKRRSYQLIEMEALKPTCRLVSWNVEEHKTHKGIFMRVVFAVPLQHCCVVTSVPSGCGSSFAGSLGNALTERLAAWASMRVPEGMQAHTCAGSVHLCTPVIGRTHQEWGWHCPVKIPRLILHDEPASFKVSIIIIIQLKRISTYSWSECTHADRGRR